MAHLEVFTDAGALFAADAHQITNAGAAAVQHRGRASLAL